MSPVRRLVALLVATALALGLGSALPGLAPRVAAAAAGSIGGTVTSDLGVGVSVYVKVMQRSGSDWQYVALARAAASGSFVATGLAAGTYRLEVFDDRGVYPEGWLLARGSGGVLTTTVTAGRRTTVAAALAAPFVEQRAAGTVDPGDRAAVTQLWRSVRALVDRNAASTSVPASCRAGSTADSSVRETARVVNAARSLAGVAPVGMDAALSTRAQQAALMMAAENRLSHSPARPWRCLTDAGATAAGKSNLALGVSGAGAVRAYLDDPGTTNTAVGHRRWVLSPWTTRMGTGNSTARAGGQVANALYVAGPTSTAAAAPRWTGWPTAGYFPWAFEPEGRWSLSVNRADVTFESATVTVTRNGQRLPVAVQPVAVGYALNTVVFQVSGLTAPTGTAAVSYRVTVTGAKQRGTALPAYAYTVSFIAA